jgi:hypothetical protein
MTDHRITVGTSDDGAPQGDGGPDPASEAEALPPISITEPTATTISQEVFAALEYQTDVGLINELWWDHTNSHRGGFERGVQFWVDNNYPDMG